MCCVAPLRLGCHAAQEGDSSPETRGRHTAPYTSHPAPAQGDSAQYRSWRGGGGGGPGGKAGNESHLAADLLTKVSPRQSWGEERCSVMLLGCLSPVQEKPEAGVLPHCPRCRGAVTAVASGAPQSGNYQNWRFCSRNPRCRIQRLHIFCPKLEGKLWFD